MKFSCDNLNICAKGKDCLYAAELFSNELFERTKVKPHIVDISENAFIVNQFKTDITNAAQNYVDSVMSKHGIKVQLGNFTGLTILSEFGPYIPMDVDATSSIGCEVISTFESCGVNQTLHRLELKMDVDIYVGNPFRIESIAYSTNYEISQTIVVGNIPSAYGTISRY